MKKKLTLLFTLLTLCVSGAWADETVIINDQTDLAAIDGAANKTTASEGTATHKYGVYSGSDAENTPPYTTFTTNATSGRAGVTVTISGKIMKPTYEPSSSTNYQHVISLFSTYEQTNANTYTMTIAAPSGYYIKSYTLKAISTSSGGRFYIAPAGESNTPVSTTLTTFTKTVCASTATLTLQRYDNNKTTQLCIPQFSVVLAPIPSYDGSYTSLSINNTTGPTVDAYGKSWTSTSTPAGLQLTCTANNMAIGATANLHSAGGQTYTLTAPSGYLITGYTIGMYGGAAGSFITPSGCGATLVGTDSFNPTFVYVTGLSNKSTTFTRSGTSTHGYATTFTVYLKPTYVVTYKVVDNSGNEMTSEDVEYIETSSTSNPSSFTNAFVTLGDNFYANSSLTGDPITSVSAATTLYKLGTIHDCPVDFSTVGSPKWYLIHFGDANKTWYGVNGSTALTIKNQEQYDATDGFSWAFIGNPYKVKLYNKDAEAYINVGTPSGTGEITNPINTTDGTAWIINGGAKTGVATDFGLQYPGKNLFINAFDGGNKFGLWSTGTSGDYGSTMRVTDLETFDHIEFVNTYIKPYIDSPSDAYYAISSAQATSLSSTYGKDSYSASDYKDYLDALNAAIKIPSDGYYVLKNVNTGTYLKMNDVIGVGAANTDATAIIKLTTSGLGFNLQIQGGYIQVPPTYAQVTTSSSPAVLYTFVQSPGVIKVGTTAGAHTYMNYKDGTVKGYEPTTNTGWWILEDAPDAINILLNAAEDNTGTAHTYATLCVPFNITGLTGANSKEVKAYKPTIDGSYLVPGTGDTEIAAGTPVLLIGEVGATSVTATIGSTYVTSPVAPSASDVLTGVFVGTEIDCTAATGTNYVLGKDVDNSNRVGFYHVDDDEFPLGANRAYFVSGTYEVKGFQLMLDDDNETGINTINGSELMVNGPIYNLAGQRLNKMQKGINIVNGKKVLK